MTTDSLPLRPAGSEFARSWALLFLLLIAYLAIYAYFYPPTFGIEDEAGYVNQAYVWLHGSVSSEGAGLGPVADFDPIVGRSVSFRHPGRAITLLPFLAAFGIRSIFVSSIFIHLLTVLAAALLLTRLGKPPLWAMLLLFHPTMALYSRTVMSDGLSGMFLLLAVLAVTNRSGKGFWSGLALGAAVLTRYHVAVVVPLFLIVLFFDQGRRQALICLLTTGVWAVLIAVYNYKLFHNFSGGYGNHAAFGAQYFFSNLAFYAVAFLAIWPLQLLAPVMDSSPVRWYARACCLPVFVLLLFYFYHETGTSMVQTLVLGQRLMLTILPLWIVGYAYSADTWLRPIAAKLLPRTVQGLAVAAFACALIVGTAMLFRTHQAHLWNLKNATTEIDQVAPAGTVLVANRNLTKFFGTPATGLKEHEWLVYQFEGVALDHSQRLAAEPGEWYLAILARRPGDELPDTLNDYIARYHLVKLPTKDPNLIFYRAPGGPPAGVPTPGLEPAQQKQR